MHSVFVYGTLMADEVVSVLLARPHTRFAATLAGFKRHRIRQQVFPAITPATDTDEVAGWVISDLTDRELEIFDDFEDVEYYRDRKPVLTQEGKAVSVFVYVWKDVGRHLLYGDWDYDEFREKHLQKYLSMCSQYAGHPNEAGPTEADIPA